MGQYKDDVEAVSNELELFLRQISWSTFSSVVRASRKLNKEVTAGGVRLLEKNRNRIQRSVKNACLRNEQLLSIFFTNWFNQQTPYHECLKPFFESEEHEDLRIELDCEPHEYVIDDTYFQKFLTVLKPTDINKFLLLSPIKFTSSQRDELHKVLESEKEPIVEINENKFLDKQFSNSKNSVVITKGEWKYHKNELKKSKALNKKLEGKVNKLKTKIKGYNKEKELQKDDFKHELEELNDIINSLGNENRDLEEKVELLATDIDKLNKVIENKGNRIKKLEKSIAERNVEEDKYFVQIIERLDIEELYEGTNAPNDIVELLSTVIRPPSTDDFNAENDSISLKRFWKSLVVSEGKTVRNLLDISAKGVANFSYYKDWDQQVDDFTDLKSSLSARIYLIDMFHEILHLNLSGKSDSEKIF